MKSTINYTTVQSTVAKHDKGAITLIVFLYKTWAKESNRLASLADNPYGATGFTVGKFIAEWSSTLEFTDQRTRAVSFKKRIEQMHRVASKGIDINKIMNTAHLAELDVKKDIKQVATKPAKPSAKRLAKLAEILLANGATKAEVAYLIK
jgi:hypothetical protein